MNTTTTTAPASGLGGIFAIALGIFAAGLLALAHEAPEHLHREGHARVELLAIRRRGVRQQHPELRQQSTLRDRVDTVVGHRGPLVRGDHPLRDRDDGVT